MRQLGVREQTDGSEGAESATLPSDEELMTCVRAGDHDAFGQLVARHWGSLVAFCGRYVDELDTAEDLAQETLARVWAHRKRWEPCGSARGYLLRIARNLALQEKERRHVRLAWRSRKSAEPAPSVEQEDLLGADRLRRALAEAVNSLPERRREVLVLARFHGLAYREIAEVLSISEQTVANHMSAALATLRSLLARFRP